MVGGSVHGGGMGCVHGRGHVQQGGMHGGRACMAGGMCGGGMHGRGGMHATADTMGYGQ